MAEVAVGLMPKSLFEEVCAAFPDVDPVALESATTWTDIGTLLNIGDAKSHTHEQAIALVKVDGFAREVTGD